MNFKFQRNDAIIFFLCLMFLSSSREFFVLSCYTAYSVSAHIYEFVTKGTQQYSVLRNNSYIFYLHSKFVYILKCSVQSLFFEITALWHTTTEYFFNDESEGTLIYCIRVLKHPKLYQNFEFFEFSNANCVLSLAIVMASTFIGMIGRERW